MASFGSALHPQQNISLQIVFLMIAGDIKDGNIEGVFGPLNTANADVDIASQKNHIGFVPWSGEGSVLKMKVG